MSEQKFRFHEIIEAMNAREGTSPDSHISPSSPIELRQLILASMYVSIDKLALFGQITEKAQKELKDDLNFVALAGFGSEFLDSPGFAAMYAHFARDMSDAILAQARKRGIL